MKAAGLLLGIFVMLGACIAFIPFLGWMNWGVIPVAIIGLVISIVAMANSKENQGNAIAGIVLCVLSIIIGAFRLTLGGGIF